MVGSDTDIIKAVVENTLVPSMSVMTDSQMDEVYMVGGPFMLTHQSEYLPLKQFQQWTQVANLYKVRHHLSVLPPL